MSNVLHTEIALDSGIVRLDLDLDRNRNNGFTLNKIPANDVRYAQIRCCAEHMIIQPDKHFIQCRNCGHGYMLHKGEYVLDGDKRIADVNHVHLFHKTGIVSGTLERDQGPQPLELRIEFGAPAGSSRGIYGEGIARKARITCCLEEFEIPAYAKKDDPEKKEKFPGALCPDCGVYSYKLFTKSAKAIVSWEDAVLVARGDANSKAYQQSTRRFDASK